VQVGAGAGEHAQLQLGGVVSVPRGEGHDASDMRCSLHSAKIALFAVAAGSCEQRLAPLELGDELLFLVQHVLFSETLRSCAWLTTTLALSSMV
jgi:hypothetical protein